MNVGMASGEGDPSPSPEVVGNTFVYQYYHALNESPELVYKFYRDSSVISRSGHDGEMTIVTTLQNINEMILSLDYKICKTEILTADSQRSFNGGVFVMVTGCLTEKDNQKRKFSQMFFLAPQRSGFFVLNDIFRYSNECSNDENVDSDKVVECAPDSPTPPDPEKTNDDHKSNPSEQNENTPLVEEVNGDQVNAVKDKSLPFHSRVSPIKSQRKAQIPQPPEDSSQKIEPVVEKSDASAVKAYAIFVPNLPMNATIEELEKTFLEFGPIRPNGIQIRNSKGYCFGFVQFESATSMQNALKAAPIVFANRKLFIAERRTNNDRGRFSSGQGSNRNENYGPGVNFGEGRGFAKHDSGQRPNREFSGRSRGNYEPNGGPNTRRYHRNWEGRRVGEAGKRFHQNGEGRVH